MRKTWKKTLASLLALALIVGTWSEGFINVKANEEDTNVVVENQEVPEDTAEEVGESVAVFSTKNATPVLTVTANSITEAIVYDGVGHSNGTTLTLENGSNLRKVVDAADFGYYYFEANGNEYRTLYRSWDTQSTIAQQVKNVGDTQIVPRTFTVEKKVYGSLGFTWNWESTSDVTVNYVNGSATVVPATKNMNFFVVNPSGWGYIQVGSGSITGNVLEAKNAHGLFGTEIIRFADGYCALTGAYSISYPASYVDIKVDGVTYTYDPACNRANTYSIEWTNVKAVWSADEGYIYHCNGTVKLQKENIYSVVFSVAQPGADYAVVSATSQKEGSAIDLPAVAEVIEANGTKYIFSGWYTDAACTTPASVSTLSADSNFYGKYVEVQTLTLVPAFTTATYDGYNHVVNGFETTQFNGLTVSGLSVYAEGKNAGSYDIEVTGSAVVTDAAGNDVTKYYNVVVADADLVIAKRSVTVTSATDSKEYDGTALTNNDVTVEGKYVDGETPEYVFAGTQTELGTSENAFEVVFPEGVNADNYNVTKVYGDLTVTQITGASITFDTLTRAYNGQALVGTYQAEGFLASHHVVVAEPASITDKGEAVNTGVYAIVDAEGNDVSKYYDTITVTDGKLTVSPLKVTVAVQGNIVNVYYTGFELESKGYEVTSISSDLYTAADFTFSGNAVVRATQDSPYGYAMGLKADQFTNDNDNFDVIFEVTDGYLKIYYDKDRSPAREDGTTTPEVTEPEVEAPVVEVPVVEEPEVEEPVVEEPEAEEPVVEEDTVVEEPEVEVEVVDQDVTDVETNGDLVQIEDEETPLANMDLDGDGNGPIFWILLAGVLATVALFFIIFIVRRKKDEEEEEQA